MRSKVGLTDPNKDMLQVSSLLEEPVRKGSKPKETRRKIEFTDSIEGPLEKPSNSRRRRSKLHTTDPDEDSFMNSSKELVGKVTKSKKSRGKLDVINSNKVERMARDSFFFLASSVPFDNSSFACFPTNKEKEKEKDVPPSKPISYIFELHPPTDILFDDYSSSLEKAIKV